MKYYLVKHSYDRNYSWYTSYCYTTDKAKANERFEWANNHFDFYNVALKEIELTENQVKEILDEIGKDVVKINDYSKDYFVC